MDDPALRFRQLLDDYNRNVHSYGEYVARRTQLLDTLTQPEGVVAQAEVDDTVNLQEYQAAQEAAVVTKVLAPTRQAPPSRAAVPMTSPGDRVSRKTIVLALVVVTCVVGVTLGMLRGGDDKPLEVSEEIVTGPALPPLYTNSISDLLSGSNWGEEEIVRLEGAWLNLSAEQQRVALSDRSYRELVAAVRSRAYELAALPATFKDKMFDEIQSVESLARNMAFVDSLPDMQTGPGVDPLAQAASPGEMPEPEVAELPATQSTSAEEHSDKTEPDGSSQQEPVRDDLAGHEGTPVPVVTSEPMVVLAGKEVEIVGTSDEAALTDSESPEKTERLSGQTADQPDETVPMPTASASAESVPAASSSSDRHQCNIAMAKAKRSSCYDLLPEGSRGPVLAVIGVGSVAPEGSGAEAPAAIQLQQPLAVQVYETTLEQYLSFCEQTQRDCEAQVKAEDRGRDATTPVTGVNWSDADAYAKWMTDRTGQIYRLPTRREAEYYIRGGTATRVFTGDMIDLAAARFDSDSPVSVNDTRGSFNANPFRLYHTLGNVREWSLPEADEFWVTGGDFSSPQARLESAFVEAVSSQLRDDRTGFRLVREIEQ